MNREIEFKGKTKYSPQWVYGSLLHNVISLTGEHDINGQITIDNKTSFTAIVDVNGCVYEIIPETKCQYIGKKDKNGKKIYEGDMVNWGEKFIVVYTCGKFALKKPTNTLYDYDYIFTDSILESCEIIGNIHDNKNLLEGKV